MQTDSVLDAQDREIMWRWGQPATREFFTENASNCSRIAGELSRLEQENQRLQNRVDSLDCARKLALGEVERLTKDNQRLRENEDGLEEIARSWQADWNVERDALTAARAEVQRLRETAERDKAVLSAWQQTIDHLEAENTRICNQLRLALILSDPGKVDSVMERISLLETTVDSILSTVEKLAERPHDHGPVPMLKGIDLTINGILERISTLEGRVQGIIEGTKAHLESHDARLRRLEGLFEFFTPPPVTVASNIPPFNQGYNDGKPARNPFEDLRPPRGL